MSEFKTINDIALHLRTELEQKKYLLLFAYNGTGKTRLSMEFKDIGKKDDGRDTLYFNAFTEDLFHWDNDLDGDSDRVLKLNPDSRFFAGLESLAMDRRIGDFLEMYTDFDFAIDYKDRSVSFSRTILNEGYDENAENNLDQERERREENIKISRGEESIFIWCFFLAVVEIAMDKEIEAYQWVKYIYIDDPVSSLDENNIIAIAHHLAQILKQKENNLKTLISSHHTLFFNVMYNELKGRKKLQSYFLSRLRAENQYLLKSTGDTPFFHHVATLVELHKAVENGKIYTHHFNTLRIILEKSASFHGFNNFSELIQGDDSDSTLYARLINILNHGNYSLYEPIPMMEENKAHFKRILENFMNNYTFNPELFSTKEE